MTQARLRKLQSRIRQPVSILGRGDGGHLRYFTGIGGLSGVLLVTKKQVFLITSDTDLARETGIKNIIRPEKRHSDELIPLLKKLRIRTLGVDFGALPYKTHEKLRKHRIRVVDVGKILQGMRGVKQKDEIARIRRACALADRAMNAARGALRPGVTEREVRRIAVDEVLGKCEKLAFDFIVASGKHSLYTHTYPTNKRIRASDLVIVDLGVTVDGYNSDTTRTFCMKPDGLQKGLYVSVMDAYYIAVAAAKPGTKCLSVYNEVGRYFARNKLSPFWKYGLGHGVGMDVHEVPSLAKGSKDTLRRNMVFTIEPGLHIPGIGGARVEDTFLLGKTPERLTRSRMGLIP